MPEKIGCVGKPHGLLGGFYLGGRNSPLADSVGAQVELAGETVEIVSQVLLKGRTVLTLSGFGSRTAIEAVRTCDLYMCLPEDFRIGLQVLDSAGEVLGKVVGVSDYGASEILDIEGPGGSLQLPWVREYFTSTEKTSASAPLQLRLENQQITDLWCDA